MPNEPDSRPLPDDDLARLVDAALAQADAERPLWDALDAAVDAHGMEAVCHALRLLAAAEQGPVRAAA